MGDLMRVGPVWGGTGTPVPQTADLSGAQRMQDAHARYLDAVRNGNVYGLSARNLTLAAGQGYAQAAAATANFLFWNPLQSGKFLVLMKFVFCTLSGTPAAGEVNYQLSQGNQITTASNGVHVNTFTGAIAGSVAKSRVNTSAAAFAGTAAFNDLRPAFSQLAVAASSMQQAVPAVDLLDGEIILQPGMAFTFGVGGAGTSHVASVGLVWEEIPAII
jgi:hypothetical protein